MQTERKGRRMANGWRWGVGGAAVAALAIGLGVWQPWTESGGSEGEAIENVEFAPPKPSEKFDGANAHKYLVDLCKLGPRLTASRPMKRQQQLLKEHFEKLGAEVELQKFSARQPSRSEPFECVNVLVRHFPDRKKRVLLSCHYDTRPMADREPPLSTRRGQFHGANDAAASVAFLMELGRLLPNLDLQVGVDFAFFDAEEFIYDTERDNYFIGSEEFVRKLVADGGKERYAKVLNLDMIAGKDLKLHPDMDSSIRAGALVDEVWGIARELGISEFAPAPKHEVRDDHLSFLNVGINAADLIDFDYEHWHRLSDTPQNCSAESMSKVAAVIVEWLKRQR
jgi:glutaminyl-peptide cyclotransferase